MLARPTIRELLSYRLHRVANLLSREAELRYRRDFGVSLSEGRTVALLGASEEALSPGELARAAGVDKSQMSRVVAALARRGIVLRANDRSDARSVRLRLSARGRRLYAGLIAAAAEETRRCLPVSGRASAPASSVRSTSSLRRRTG